MRLAQDETALKTAGPIGTFVANSGVFCIRHPIPLSDPRSAGFPDTFFYSRATAHSQRALPCKATKHTDLGAYSMKTARRFVSIFSLAAAFAASSYGCSDAAGIIEAIQADGGKADAKGPTKADGAAPDAIAAPDGQVPDAPIVVPDADVPDADVPDAPIVVPDADVPDVQVPDAQVVVADAGKDSSVVIDSGKDGAVVIDSGKDGAVVIDSGKDGAVVIDSGKDGAVVIDSGKDTGVPNICAPDVVGFSSATVKKARKQSVCSNKQVSDFVDSGFNPNSTLDYQTWSQTTSNTSCVSCLLGDVSDTDWAPFLFDGQSTRGFNYAGCLELRGAASSCPQAVDRTFSCLDYACEPCSWQIPDGAPANDPTRLAYSACRENAATDTTACGTVAAASNICAVKTGADGGSEWVKSYEECVVGLPDENDNVPSADEDFYKYSRRFFGYFCGTGL